MLTLKEIEEKLQFPFNKAKIAEDWLTIYVYSVLSRPIIRLLLLTPVTANQVTASMIIIGIVGCLLFTFGQYWYSLIAIILIQIQIILDHVDGPIARAKNNLSLKGIYIERIGHDLTFTMFFYCISIGVLKKGFSPIFMLIIGFCASFGYFFYKHTRRVKIYCTLIYDRTRKTYEEINLKNNFKDNKMKSNRSLLRKIYRKAQILWEPIIFINITTLAAIFDILYIIPIFYGLTYPLHFIISYIYQTKTGNEWVYEWLKRA